MSAIEKQDIYDPKFVEELFDEMSGSYERMNYITSFGFSARWRRQLVEQAELKEGQVVADLLTGMGECWKPILKQVGPNGKIDRTRFFRRNAPFCACYQQKFPAANIQILHEDLFQNSIPDGSVDRVISGFGMKTFSEAQIHSFATAVHRMLKPGGQLSFMDVAVPKYKLLRWPYLFYLKRIIPILGWMFIGNPENYRMLGIYSERFGNAEKFAKIFQAHGLEVEHLAYFYGCASGLVGKRPN
jgi:ubiquinone/menaquinone biosynthesis C-methylase UbiE